MSGSSPIIKAFLADLKREVAGEVRADAYSRLFYSTDASIYQAEPYGVLIPRTADDLHAAMTLAASYRLPVLARAAGSSLAGQAVGEALVIDTTRHLDQVLELNVEEQWVRVQPGLVLDELNLYLKPFGLQFGPDPASSNRAAMGGIVSNNSTGSHSIRYGMTADHVREMRVVLSDGTWTTFGPVEAGALASHATRSGLEGRIYRDLLALTRSPAHQAIIRAGTPRHWRRCGGYNLDRMVPSGGTYLQPQDPRFNLSKLVCGAEGTLAVIADVTLNLVPIPRKTALAVVHFDSLYAALEAVPRILEVGPSAVELIDHLGLTLCQEVPAYARLLRNFIEGSPNCVLITEFYGEDDAHLGHQIERLEAHLKAVGRGVQAVVPVRTAAAQQEVWTVRKVGLGLLMSIKGDHKPIPFIEDAAVPVAHLAEYVTRVERFCNDLGTDVAYYAHASAGCVHIRPLINTKDARDVAKLPEITAFSVELLRGYGGSLSSEHGDGRVRSAFNERFFGPDLYGLYQAVKRIFDPEALLNPGNIVDAAPMTEHLRFGPNYEVVPLQLNLDFSAEHGFDRAIEMCNGAGICRKKTTGTMCPSFMATREEEHSTRGRANALRAALSGHLGDGALTSERMYEVMDLCVGCKACKAECPSSVDMAKIKVEFLAQYYARNGVPLRGRLFAAIPALSRWFSGRMAPLANWTMRQRWLRHVLAYTLGVSPERPLPSFARHPFTWTAPPDERPRVVLFHDTFNTYNTPAVAEAAARVLDGAGFQVVPSRHGCCGRPMISSGLVAAARQAASATVAALYPWAAAGLPIIGLEPSCILTLRDEYTYLLPDDPRVERVASAAVLLEDFIADTVAGALPVPGAAGRLGRVLYHGHCHQKALVGTGAVHSSLAWAGFDVEEVDSGCCGMAGSFGYEAEHIGLSMRMAERRLLPAMRKAGHGTTLAATGFSCRHQIHLGTGREALHPAQLLWQSGAFDRTPATSP